MRAALLFGHGGLFLSALVHIALTLAIITTGHALDHNMSTHAPGPTPELALPVGHLYKRKIVSEDPANPVAAAALDPNEAAMGIKSRDLVPTDRAGGVAVRPQLHHHSVHAHLDEDEEGGSDDVNIKIGGGSSSGAKHGSGSSNSAGGGKNKGVARDDDDELASDSDDTGSSKSRAKNKGKGKSRDLDNDGSDDELDKSDKSSKPKSKKGSSKSKGRGSSDADDDGDDDKDKDSKETKDSKSGGSWKGKGIIKNTHTGLDGKEVEDEDSDATRHKKVQVEHVKAKKKNWRTGKPMYDYQKALEGWKSAGPMYYYRGKYLNAAPMIRIAAGTWATVLVSAGWMLL